MAREDFDIMLGSRTQSLETIQKILEEDGYDHIETDEIAETPEPEPEAIAPPATKPKPKAAAPEEPAAPGDQNSITDDTSAPTPEAGESAGDDGEGESTEGESETPPPQEHKKTSGSAKLAKRVKEKDSEIARLRAEIQERDRKLAEYTKPAETKPAIPEVKPVAETKPAPPVLDPEPKLDDLTEAGEAKFAEHEDWLKAWNRWDRKRERLEEQQEQEQQRQAQAESEAAAHKAEADQKATERWTSQAAAAREKWSDFDESLAKQHFDPQGKPLQIHNPILITAIASLDEAADLAYWLATHPDEAHRIAVATDPGVNPSPHEVQRKFALAYRELGKLDLTAPAVTEEEEEQPHAATGAVRQQPTDARRETRVAAAPKAPPAKAPNLPPVKPAPPTPVGTRTAPVRHALDPHGYGISDEELRNMPDDQYRKLRGL